ncbi:hypothetical protein MPDQ_000637 [Monascus purpureus]|uniref:Uncharacterized protein n=1 Tax=Monascus purpureus TaxID=5098 RepID=A0A507QRR9_MONPU|nr:hypothetical protein MPDQ_000637 [Monascus purpureus]
MPRTLPWLTVNDSNQRVKKESTPRQTQVKSVSSVDAKKTSFEPLSSPSEKRDFLRSSQTPPTSPIQRCPPSEENDQNRFLIEGLDNDDIYVMVEDEFYAVAQTFTRNLHYAEYVRRKKEAKLRNEATIRGISRPTDGVTSMTDETRRRKVSEALSARQKAGLNQTMGKRPRVDSEDERDGLEAEDAEEDGDGLWAGTSLHNLMMSPRSARSLVGLQGVKSSTRAAAGYSQTSNSSRSRTGNAGFSSPLRRPQAETPRPVPIEVDDDTASEEDDDDLNIPAIKESSVRKSIRQQPQHLQRDLKLSRTKPNSPTMRSSHRRNHSITEVKKEKPFDDFDGFLQDTEISSSTDRFSKKDSRDADSGSKKPNLNEVPTFLV